jgi:Kef-type K+ transport system membrane component KefB
VLTRVRVPGPVLEIVAGIVLGPAVLDLVKPDQAVGLTSTIGLAFLLFLAGLEVDVRHFRGPRARLAAEALGLSALLALVTGILLHATGLAESPLLVGIILLATSLGLITPILEDAGVADRPVGQFAIAGASLGEVSPVILLSLFFSDHATAIGPKLLLLSLLGVLIVLVVIATLPIERSMWITRMINRLADTSAQIRIRLSILLVTGLGALATHLGSRRFSARSSPGRSFAWWTPTPSTRTRCSTRNSRPSAMASSSRSSSSPAGSPSTCRCCSRAPLPCCGYRSSCWPC